MGQGQLRVIIYIKLEELEYIILRAKFHDHRTISSVGENFLKVFTISWRPSWPCDSLLCKSDINLMDRVTISTRLKDFFKL